jgi:hypothetical protein
LKAKGEANGRLKKLRCEWWPDPHLRF